MSSLEEFEFSSETINNDLPPPIPFCRNLSAATSDFIDDLLVEANINPDSFDPTVFDSFSDEPIEGLNEAQASIFIGEVPNLLEQLTESIEKDCTVIEPSNIPSQTCKQVDSLRLLIPPHPYQRARYDGEIDEDLRFVSTPNNEGIELEISDIRSRKPANMSPMLRVSRTTTAFGTDQTICCHPYPLYTKNEHATVHDGSLLFPVSDKNMEEQRIKINDLIMVRLKQPTLKTKKQWPIFTYNQLNCDGYQSINIGKAKSIINIYNLRYSVLRFQILLVDENQVAYPTDLWCETVPIYEYEYKEQTNIPEQFRKNETAKLNIHERNRIRSIRNVQEMLQNKIKSKD